MDSPKLDAFVLIPNMLFGKVRWVSRSWGWTSELWMLPAMMCGKVRRARFWYAAQ
jgi:hypothetical protein